MNTCKSISHIVQQHQHKSTTIDRHNNNNYCHTTIYYICTVESVSSSLPQSNDTAWSILRLQPLLMQPKQLRKLRRLLMHVRMLSDESIVGCWSRTRPVCHLSYRTVVRRTNAAGVCIVHGYAKLGCYCFCTCPSCCPTAAVAVVFNLSGVGGLTPLG